MRSRGVYLDPLRFLRCPFGVDPKLPLTQESDADARNNEAMWDVMPFGSPSETKLPEMGEENPPSTEKKRTRPLENLLTMRRELRIPVRNVHLVYIIYHNLFVGLFGES